jgi:hypothetical protein
MRWVVLAIVLVILPYTWITLRYRKEGKAFEPYADMKEEANRHRVREAGYRQARVRALRPAPALSAGEITRLERAEPLALAGGLPADLAATLVETPRLPVACAELVAPKVWGSLGPVRIQFSVTTSSPREHFAGADVYVRESEVVIVPRLEPAPGELKARDATETVLLELPPGLFSRGMYQFTLAAERGGWSWSAEAK